jgi:membrane-bound lytic murein transglycosylase B
MLRFCLAFALLLPSALIAAPHASKNAIEEKHPGSQALALQAADNDPARAARFMQVLNQGVYQQSIIDAITRPAEAKPWKDYRPIFITPERIQGGVAFWQTHADALARVQENYKVPAEYIVAIIGVETAYGKNSGKYKVLDALTTLGLYYPPRQPFFSGELKQLLKFTEQDRIQVDVQKSLGSYAGAMGLGQFMPSSYANYAVDGDADGRIDLFSNHADVFSSVANYFIGHGWEPGGPVMTRAQKTANARALNEPGIKPVFSVGQLAEWGYRSKLTLADERLASVLKLEGMRGFSEHLIFQNFYVITRYNRSPLYATAVHQLAQAIARDYKRTLAKNTR